MRRLLLIARHEFVKYVTRRGFIISIFMMPAWIAFAGIVPRWIEHNAPPRYFVVVDHAGGYADAIAASAAAHNFADARTAFAAYARAHADLARLRAHDPHLFAIIAAPDGDDVAARQFRAAGGIGALLPRLRPFLASDAPRFNPPAPKLIDLVPPPALMSANAKDFPRRAARILSAPHAPDAILVVPKDFGADGAAAQFWSSGPPKGDLKAFLGAALTQALRRATLHKVAPAASPALLNVSARLRSLDPTHGGAAVTLADQVERYAPSGLAFLLVLTIFMNAASLMSAVIEEKSSRIVEVMLSCVSPREFMAGKLLGAAGASLLTLALWIGMAVLAAWVFLPGGPALVAGIAGGLATGPLLPLLVVCFLSGLLIYASIFLAIGSMSASIQDAQALLGPTMIVVMAPMLIMPALLRDPNGTVATVMTWIPIYTPFFMMFRLPWNPPQIEIWLGMALMVATAAFLVWQMGRVFATHVLTAERPPRLAAALRAILGGGRNARLPKSPTPPQGERAG